MVVSSKDFSALTGFLCSFSHCHVCDSGDTAPDCQERVKVVKMMTRMIRRRNLYSKKKSLSDGTEGKKKGTVAKEEQAPAPRQTRNTKENLHSPPLPPGLK